VNILMDKATESLVMQAPDPLLLRELLPSSKTLSHPDFNIAIHHTLEATKVLRNLGFEAPAPIRAQYEWPGRFKPYPHQIAMAEFLTMHRRCFNLSEMGTMKTNAALWAADWLMKTGRVQRALVISPLSTLESVWRDDIFDTLPHRTSAILHGAREKRLRYLGVDADFYILNHDGLKIAELAAAIQKRPDIDLVIVDEAGMYRNHSAEKYKALAKLIKNRPDIRLWMMTGTPCPNAPTDAWALARLVDPSRVPQFAGAFQRETMMKITQFKWVAKADAYERAYKAMQPAIRFRKKDCIALPPVTTQNHGTKITPEQAKAVKELKDHMTTQTTAGVKITAANAADQINKMRQILCGALKDPMTGTYLPIKHGPRLQTLLDAIESASAKVIVVVPFKGIIRVLAEELKDSYSCAIVNGDVPPTKRAEIFKAFKTQAEPQVLLCHPAVMAHGLNLTEADTLIFYAPIYSNDEVEQVNERFNRAGQTRPMTIVRIGCHPLEWEIYKLTDTRKEAQNSILELYEIAMR
jgi:SNF2 family DNA or RNA helicase